MQGKSILFGSLLAQWLKRVYGIKMIVNMQRLCRPNLVQLIGKGYAQMLLVDVSDVSEVKIVLVLFKCFCHAPMHNQENLWTRNGISINKQRNM